MSRYQGRRRKRGVYIGPIHLLMLGVVVVVTGGLLLRFALSGGEGDRQPHSPDANKPQTQEPDSQEPEQKDPGPDENGPDENGPDAPDRTTASGLRCTLTDLGPDAIHTGTSFWSTTGPSSSSPKIRRRSCCVSWTTRPAATTSRIPPSTSFPTPCTPSTP